MAGSSSTSPADDPRSITVRQLQTLERSEAITLSRIRQELDPGRNVTVDQLIDDVDYLISGGGRAWILHRHRSVAGFASVMPAPGLPGLYELDGFVAPAFQRQGLASALLATVIDRLAKDAGRQLYYPALSMESPAAQFLIEKGFFIEHEEQLLVLDNLATLPAVELGEEFSLLTFAQRQAIAHFRRLYEASFADLAWYQPYESDQEVAQELADSGDLLFLADRGRPIGFLWLRWPELRSAEIEPLGLLPSYRGQGLGRQLMLAGLRRAVQQGAAEVRVGAWRTNTVALALYEQLDFRLAKTKLYLAYDL